MLYLANTSDDPAFNLALEEFLVKTTREPYASSDLALLWQNRPTVVVGRNQNTAHELNRELVEERGITVVRRMSGGGAVYHDEGNINYTVILRDSYAKKGDFRFFTQPLARALASIGIQAEFSGRNDVEIAGAKFSGNAQYSYKNTVLHHGTILYNSDLSVLGQVLKPKKASKVSLSAGVAKGVASVKRSVTNIAEHTDMKAQDFMSLFARFLVSDNFSEDKILQLSEEELAEVSKLADEKYRSVAWTWGKSPQYNEIYEERFEGGNLMLALRVEDERIVEFDIYGDFFEKKSVAELAESFLCLKRSELAEAFQNTAIEDYIFALGREEFIHLLAEENLIK